MTGAARGLSPAIQELINQAARPGAIHRSVQVKGLAERTPKAKRGTVVEGVICWRRAGYNQLIICGVLIVGKAVLLRIDRAEMPRKCERRAALLKWYY